MDIDLSIKSYSPYQCVKWLCNPYLNPVTGNLIIKDHYNLLYRDTMKNLKPKEIKKLNEDMYNILNGENEIGGDNEIDIISIIDFIKTYNKDNEYDFDVKNICEILMNRLYPEDIYELNSELFYELELDKKYEIIEVELN